MHILRVRIMAWSLVFMMVMIAGCTSDQAKHLPPVTLEEILANKEEGIFAGDRYDKQAILGCLKKFPRGLSSEEAYSYILSLVGETYVRYQDVYVSQWEDGSVNQVNGQEILWETNKSMFETYKQENRRLKVVLTLLQDKMSYEDWSVIDEWVINRWTLLSNYQMEQDLVITKKIFDESLGSSAK